jgi:hypothetical protein
MTSSSPGPPSKIATPRASIVLRLLLPMKRVLLWFLLMMQGLKNPGVTVTGTLPQAEPVQYTRQIIDHSLDHGR